MNQKFLLSQTDVLPFETQLLGQDARHVFKVLRLRPDAEISLTDGKGTDYTGRILTVSASRIDIRVERSSPSATESPLEITLGCAMLKDKKMDLVIKHITQLGVYRWLPFYCDRSVPQPSSKRIEARRNRWETISNESVKQCRRSRTVEIAMPVPFDALLETAEDYDICMTFWEKESAPLSALKTHPAASKVLILIGPEGGFTQEEIKAARDRGFITCSLGPRILRAETAAISACTLVQHILGDI